MLKPAQIAFQNSFISRGPSSNNSPIFLNSQAISQYCRYYHQTKPFSHVVIDMFKETVSHLQAKHSKQMQQLHRKSVADLFSVAKEEQKSDTDSGHSSIHGEKELVYRVPPQKIQPASNLTVTRPPAERIQKQPPPNVYAIGDEHPMEERKEICAAKLQVVRRKDAILRRRNMQRRNTIDINHIDILRATNENGFNDIVSSKSTNCLDKVGGGKRERFDEKISSNCLSRSSMPSKKQVTSI